MGGCFHESCSCIIKLWRRQYGQQSISICYLAFYKKSLLTPELKLEATVPSGRAPALQVDRPSPLILPSPAWPLQTCTCLLCLRVFRTSHHQVSSCLSHFPFTKSTPNSPHCQSKPHTYLPWISCRNFSSCLKFVSVISPGQELFFFFCMPLRPVTVWMKQ